MIPGRRASPHVTPHEDERLRPESTSAEEGRAVVRVDKTTGRFVQSPSPRSLDDSTVGRRSALKFPPPDQLRHRNSRFRLFQNSYHLLHGESLLFHGKSPFLGRSILLETNRMDQNYRGRSAHSRMMRQPNARDRELRCSVTTAVWPLLLCTNNDTDVSLFIRSIHDSEDLGSLSLHSIC